MLAHAGGRQLGPLLVVLGVVIAIGFGSILLALLAIMATPVALRAGLTQDLGATFDFGWIADFLKKMWAEVLLAALFVVGLGLVVTSITCGLGGIALGALLPLIQSHFWYQFYMLYLARGGRPVTRKPAATP
jgi:hypothetical protein